MNISKKLLKYSIIPLCFIISQLAGALEFPLPPAGHALVGEIQQVIAHKGDTLSKLGMEYNIGYYEMVEANPDLPRNGKIHAGEAVIIPSYFVLPSVRKGLVINLAELRIYYFPTHENVVYTFPIGAGREGWNTPTGQTTVINKKKDPTWIVPASILAESEALGKPTKKVYPPGPDNPLGKYALYLNMPGIRIHGTNLPSSVGKRISHGCIRLLPDDIEFLYDNVPMHTPVTIIHEDNKVGWDGPILYLESEVPFSEYDDPAGLEKAIESATKHHPAIIDWQKVETVTDDRLGIPEPIGHDEATSSVHAAHGELIVNISHVITNKDDGN